MSNRAFLVFFFFPFLLFAKAVDTFYGSIEVEEPVLLDLIESRPVQRLKQIHQYGISYYTTYPEEFNRFDHSLGVFALLRLKGASLNEQIAGLLHDVSHTVFSHVGDYVFQKINHQESYQDKIHDWFLEQYGVGKILKKHGLTIEDVLHKSGDFLALEQELPDLCADRIDYNLQGAFHRGFLTREEIREIVDDLEFNDKKWSSSNPKLMKKMGEFAMHMTENCWGAPDNYLMSKWLAEAISRAIELKKLTPEEVYFGTDNRVWRKLKMLRDKAIKKSFSKIGQPNRFFTLVEASKADIHPKMKFRGVDPWIRCESQLVRLTECDPDYAKRYNQVKEKMKQGWPIKLTRD